MPHFVLDFKQECIFCSFTTFFISIKFWTNVLEGIKDRNASFFSFRSFKPWILTEDLKLTCLMFLFFIVQYVFFACDLFWTKWFILHVTGPVMFYHKIWRVSQKKALSCPLDKNWLNIFSNFTYHCQHNTDEPLKLKNITGQPKMMQKICCGI